MESELNNLIMGTGIVYLIILVVVGLIAWHDWWKYSSAVEEERYIKRLFRDCWTGKHEDIPYAWFRVIQHLKQWNPDPKLIRMAEIKREQSLRIKSDAWIVNEQGQLVEINGNSNDLEAA